MERLRASFNLGNCDLIYSESSDAFRRVVSRDQWQNTCERMRAGLGSWVSFKIGATDSPVGPTAHVAGTAVFSSGVHRFATAWNFENGRLRLFRISVGDNVVVPVFPSPHRRLLDPPPNQLSSATL